MIMGNTDSLNLKALEGQLSLKQENDQAVKKTIFTLAWFNCPANYASETIGRATSCQAEDQRLGKQNSHLENIFHVCGIYGVLDNYVSE